MFAAFRCVVLAGLFCASRGTAIAEELPRYIPTQADLRTADERAAVSDRARIYRDRISPHWFDGGSRFWYRNDMPGGEREFVLVECENGVRKPAFDHARLAASLSKASGVRYFAERLPFTQIAFVHGVASVRFHVGSTEWECDRTLYRCKKVEVPELAPAPRLVAVPAARKPRRGSVSPDGMWSASVRDFNIVLRAGEDGEEKRVTTNGREGNAYGMLAWSPDSKGLVAFRITQGERKQVYRIESSPSGGGRALLHSNAYALPGDRLTSYEVHVIDPATGEEKKVDVESIDFGYPVLHWDREGRHFSYEKVDRGHQRFRVIRVDSHTGRSNTVIDEKSDTFIWTAHIDQMGVPLVTWLTKTDELIHCSEREGWRHLYLHDAATGELKSKITSGLWVVRGIETIDEVGRQLILRGSGKNVGEDPYHIHHFRVSFDGSDLQRLTGGNGTHSVQYSPDGQFLVDTYSRADRAPIHELRRTSDGSRLCKLEEADTNALTQSGWQPPEVFTAKGRDGDTDIWGLIVRPTGFDPKKKYPVIEYIYAGPHGAHVPKSFEPWRRFSGLTDLGFLVVAIDGMGTAHRSKAFHDVCWHNLKDAGFPDRIAWHKAAAAKYPWYDATRVGIYGTSAGGQNAAAALLFHGDFYSAAVAACGCHDNRMDKASWNEQWMGYPVGPQYAASSNIDHARNLRGKLMLVVGELDENVPPESTYRFADALIKAGKDFEFLTVPGMGHSDGGAYGKRRLRDFFVRHLHGIKPPDRNAQSR